MSQGASPLLIFIDEPQRLTPWLMLIKNLLFREKLYNFRKFFLYRRKTVDKCFVFYIIKKKGVLK
jgi:hypothetical protein